MNLREKFFNTPLKKKLITVPDIGDIIVREMRMSEIEDIEKRHKVSSSAGSAFASIPEVIILCALDPESEKPLFAKEDRDAVRNLSARIVFPINSAISELSGLTKGKVDEAEKNSGSSQLSDTSSSSHGNSAAQSQN